MNKVILVSAILIIAISNFAFAQGVGSNGVSDARTMGMAKAFTASSFGLFAIGKNPANLFQDSSKKVELILPIPLPNISGAIGSNFISLDDYNYFFGTKVTNADGSTSGRLLTEQDKAKLKNLFVEGGTVTSDIHIQLVSISIQPAKNFGAFAFTVSDRISGIMTFPKSLIDLGIDGNLPNKVYNFNDTEFKASWLRKYSVSYARDLKIFKSFKVGASVNFISGFFYAGLEQVKTELKTGDANVITGKGDFLAYSAFSPDFKVKYNFVDDKKEENFSATPFPTPAGRGVGFDFGISTMLSNNFSIGFSITDIGKIKWDKEVAQYSSNAAIYLDDLTDQAQRDTLINRITGKESGKFINSIETEMATAVHIGASLKLESIPGTMLLAVDYHQGFNNEPGNSKKQRIALGIDWYDLGIFALRTGCSFGGFDKFNWALGLGIDFGLFALNFGTPDFQYLVSPNKARRITFAVDSIWRF
ncbi:MAG: hypothetical protein FD143_2365 [Ignavibacteria bacterium]|nr:MAG: hypothetical protein FD143_2365 [Ignavibacteria bacterium]KAF0155983.1 MAG: hypothetical protein FD188_3052 [Ignavibacteria bacterium]